MILHQRDISRDGPPFVMAEIGVNHDGSVARAEALVDAAKVATADAVKFQLFDADLLLANAAALVDYQKAAADSAPDLLRPLQLTPEQMAPLVVRAHAHGLVVIVTPFSPALVPAVKAMNADAIKLASPDLVNLPLLEAAAATGLPLILSTGAATLDEVERTVQWLTTLDALDRTVLLHCVSAYPTEPEHATLGAIPVLRAAFPDLPIGYSDHTVETFTAALAVTAGACLLEKHLTLDRAARGPDHAASLEPPQLAEYAALARIGYAMRGPFRKCPQHGELQVREQTRQSLTTTCDLAAGTKLTADMLTVKRPGTGIPAAALRGTLGRTLRRALPINTTLTPSDLET
jgi:N-acetylneuraminate synthase/N,N'-diacetyllegionaminate synthase